MAKRWGIKRDKLFGYALAGVTMVKNHAFNVMIESMNAEDIDKNSRAYLEVLKDYDAIKALADESGISVVEGE